MGILTRTIANKLGQNPNPGVNFRNIIINGDMSIAQRATSKTGITADGFYTCDRWKLGIGSFGTWTQSQADDSPPNHFVSQCIKMDCTTAQASPGASTSILLEYSIEGQHLQEICQGTADAKQTTLSFWHKHTKTGINTVELLDADNANAVSGSYTQSVSNTWEKAVITFPAHTAGAYDNDNNRSLRIRFAIGKGTDLTSGTLATTWQTSITNANRHAGQVNNADSASNNFMLAAVQYEIGPTASDFEGVPQDLTLGRCQRYYHQIYGSEGTQAYAGTLDLANCTNYDAGQLFCMKDLPTTMRAIPSIVQTTGTDFLLSLRAGVQDPFDGFNGVGQAGYNNIAIFTSGAENQSGVAGGSSRVRCNASYKLAANAEL
jgi:hypothetical protein